MVIVGCGAAEKVFKIMNKFLLTESTLPQCSLWGGCYSVQKCQSWERLKEKPGNN